MREQRDALRVVEVVALRGWGVEDVSVGLLVRWWCQKWAQAERDTCAAGVCPAGGWESCQEVCRLSAVELCCLWPGRCTWACWASQAQEEEEGDPLTKGTLCPDDARPVPTPHTRSSSRISLDSLFPCTALLWQAPPASASIPKLRPTDLAGITFCR